MIVLVCLGTGAGCATTSTSSNKDLWGPKSIEKFTLTQAGIDHLELSATDVILIPGKGEYKIQLSGSFAIDRQPATTDDWNTAEVFVQLNDIDLHGSAPGLGRVVLRRNKSMKRLQGQVFAVEDVKVGALPRGKKCRIPASVQFEISGMDVNTFGGSSIILFNKEPIVLKNDGIERIPPVNDDRGQASIYQLPLFDKRNPNGEPVAYLLSLDYTIGGYLPKPRG